MWIKITNMLIYGIPKKKPPSEHKLSFVSPRESARTPQYEKVSLPLNFLNHVHRSASS